MKNEKWIKFINEVIPNLEDQNILKEFVSKSYNGESYGKALVFYGDGCNGKSVMQEVISAIIDRYSVFSFDFISKHKCRDIYLIEDSKINFCHDLPKKSDIYKFKNIVLGVHFESKPLYSRVSKLIRNYANLIFNVNNIPDYIYSDQEYSRRIKIINFPTYIKNPNPHLISELYEELDGIKEWFGIC